MLGRPSAWLFGSPRTGVVRRKIAAGTRVRTILEDTKGRCPEGLAFQVVVDTVTFVPKAS